MYLCGVSNVLAIYDNTTICIELIFCMLIEYAWAYLVRVYTLLIVRPFQNIGVRVWCRVINEHVWMRRSIWFAVGL